jgi:nicotinamide phosphoribosyltransferase
MCAGSKEDEIGTFRRLLETYPTGILSIVSDTWDLWKVCTEHLVTLKEEILARDGKLVIRPDSGDPVDILCGEGLCSSNHPEFTGDDWSVVKKLPKEKGVIELLWDVFGGTINEQGYKVLDSHIGAIYGDSITIDRADEICRRLEAKGFASTNVVLGIGSFTYQYNTRDTFGFAMKATYVELTEVTGVSIGEVGTMDVNKVIGREIFKNPITDDGTKKSATGLLQVVKLMESDSYGKLHHNGYHLNEKVSWDDEANSELKTVYKDGEFYNKTTLTEVRNRLKF